MHIHFGVTGINFGIMGVNCGGHCSITPKNWELPTWNLPTWNLVQFGTRLGSGKMPVHLWVTGVNFGVTECKKVKIALMQVVRTFLKGIGLLSDGRRQSESLFFIRVVCNTGVSSHIIACPMYGHIQYLDVYNPYNADRDVKSDSVNHGLVVQLSRTWEKCLWIRKPSDLLVQSTRGILKLLWN